MIGLAIFRRKDVPVIISDSTTCSQEQCDNNTVIQINIDDINAAKDALSFAMKQAIDSEREKKYATSLKTMEKLSELLHFE